MVKVNLFKKPNLWQRKRQLNPNKMNMIEKKCGFVSITGLPNAGKSTLINNLVNEKVSIISHKVQTTQNAIRGVFTSLILK